MMKFGIKIGSALLAAALACGAVAGGDVAFTAAKPTWPAGLSAAPNTFVRFTAAFDWKDGARPVLRITGSTAYRARVNGAYAGFGPARAPMGWFRVDEWPLAAVRPGRNVVEIDVAGYRVDSFQYAPQDSFLQAEVVVDGKSLLATPAGFSATRIPRATSGFVYSRQRGFPCEAYVVDPAAAPESFKLEELPARKLLPREVPHPEFRMAGAARPTDIPGEGKVWELPGIDTGFVGVKATVTKPGRIVLGFEEALVRGRLDPFRNGHTSNSFHAVMNRVTWDVKAPGTYALETFEPYTLKYISAHVEGGEATFEAPTLRQCRNPLPARARYTGTDPELAKIFDAATSTLAQNAVDIFMDCPSRERSGWLCDSYFSSQAMASLTGDRSMERTFLENFARTTASDPAPAKSLMPGGFPKACDCMPTYMMWYVIQCAAYAQAVPEDAPRFAAFVRNRVLSNLLWMEDYVNADGLLENLPGWVFIEWSHANNLVKGVNYPANMLWARALEDCGRMYGLDDYVARAAKVRAAVRAQSFDGTWFHDQAVRRNGKLERVADRTEVCQYYAFFTRTATAAGDPALRDRCIETFRPGRALPQGVFPADMFMGRMFRLALLKEFGRDDLLAEEIKACVGYQVAESGSLWEFKDGHDSRCHGFVSYVASLLPHVPAGVRVGAVDWDCAVPRGTYFGNATAKSLGPEHWRDRTPFYAQVLGKDRINVPYRTLAEYEVELRYAIDAGLDYLAYCWYDRNPNQTPDPEHACSACGHLQEITYARLLHAKSALRDKIHICAILVAAHPYSDVELTDLALEMREPWYEKVGERPLVYYGFTSKGDVAQRLRKICRKVGAAEPYIVLMCNDPKVIARLGEEKAVDASCSYAHVASGSFREMCDTMVERNAKRASAGLPVVPHLTTGWDPRPRIEHPTPWTKGGYNPDWSYASATNGEDFVYAATKLRDWMEANPASCTTGHVLAFAWNEFEEGGWLCPNIGPDGRPDTRRVKWFRAAADILRR